MITLGEPHIFRTAVPAHPARAAGLRRMVAAHLTYWRLSKVLDSAVLAADELLANAVKHGSSGPDDTVTLTLECSQDELRVEVADVSTVPPTFCTTAGEAEKSGRGLAIVAAIAGDWGTAPPDPGRTGKKVWFTLPLKEHTADDGATPTAAPTVRARTHSAQAPATASTAVPASPSGPAKTPTKAIRP